MRIYSINVNDISEEQLCSRFEQMSSERKASVAKMQNEKKRNLRICADALCRKAISEFCGVPAEEICFELSPAGKPYAKDLPIHFSISHSGDIAVCAVSKDEIGIDIEKIRTVNPRTYERFCTKNEARYISTSENGFFEIWTLKEAYFKCIGTGLGADIKSVSFSVSGNKIICSQAGFELCFADIEKGYICSICKKTAHTQ